MAVDVRLALVLEWATAGDVTSRGDASTLKRRSVQVHLQWVAASCLGGPE